MKSTTRSPEDHRSTIRRKRTLLLPTTLRVLIALLLLLLPVAESALDIVQCTLTSHEMALSTEPIDPCLVYYSGPFWTTRQRTSIVTIVQVTPAACNNHRDGAPTAVETLNEENDGKGIAVGFNKDHYVQFRLVSFVAGNHLVESRYDEKHKAVLEDLLVVTQPQYILGTCSDVADLERDLALQYKTILMAQVGPPSFYNVTVNMYVFGFHLSSDRYTRPALQALRFYALTSLGGLDAEPVRIVYRSDPEFFRSTCEAARDFALETGFTDVKSYSFEPAESDTDRDGILDEQQNQTQQMLIQLADEVCPPGFSVDNYPAIFVCTFEEQEVLLERWKQNGCRPSMLWLAPSSWAGNNLDSVPYFQSGGQWHPSFSYGDQRFDNGTQFLEYQETWLGYEGSYDMVVSYSIPMLFAKHIQSSYRVDDQPSVEADFQSESRYEQLRRDLVALRASTLFGDFSLEVNELQNSGRGSASTQWFPEDNNVTADQCTAPLSEADVMIQVPAPSASACAAGSYVSVSKIRNDTSLLSTNCDLCPVGTFSSEPGFETQCLECPSSGSSTGEPGATSCIVVNDSVLSRPLVSMAYVAVATILSLAIAMLMWVVGQKDAALVKSSRNYLIFIICGSVVSSVSVLMISFHAGTGNTSMDFATNSCKAAPFLYCIGWVLQLGSVAGLAYPLSRYDWPSTVYSYMEPKSQITLVAGLLVDIAVLVLWTILSPMEYTRWVVSESLDLDTGLVTVNTVGFCTPVGEISIWVFIAPIIGVHTAVLLRTVFLYWKHRSKEDPNGMRRWCLYAALYAAQLLVIGVPVVVAVGNNITARYTVICVLVFCSDLGVSSILFFRIRNLRLSSPDYSPEPKLSQREHEKTERMKRQMKQDEMRREKRKQDRSGSMLNSYQAKSIRDLSGFPADLIRSIKEGGDGNVQSIDQYDCTDGNEQPSV